MATKRVVVVTGGGSGMGRATALRFSENGDTVYIVGRRKDRLEETAKLGTNIYPIVADVTDIGSIQSLKKTILKDHTSIDVLVNNAGGRGDKVADDNSSLEDAATVWDEVVKLNLSSIFYMIQCFKDSLTSPGGRVINISSMAALGGSSQGEVIGTAYAAAKSGIHGLDKTFVRSLGERGITINSVAPGFVQDTEFFSSETSMKVRIANNSEKTPLKRVGKPEEIAAGVFYLASDEASFVTGEILSINGGAQLGR